MEETIKLTLAYISKTKVWGWIPLDIVAHFSIGAIITMICLVIKLSFKKTFFIILTLAILKEFYDYPTLQSSIWENLKDIAVTMIYFFMAMTVSYIRKMANRN